MKNLSDPVKLIEKTWKAGMVSLVVAFMVVFGLFLNLSAVSAHNQPSPTPSPKASPSPTPQTSPSPTPKASPSPTPSPRPTPSPSPSVSPSPSPSPSPTPTPTPSPVVSPSPSPSSGVTIINNNENHQEQHQEQNNNQTVNITTGQVAGAKTVPAKTPDTGVSALGMVSMFGAGPVGLALSRFGRGRIVGKREEEEMSLSEAASDLLTKRAKREA